MSLLSEIQESLGGESYGKYLAVRCPFHGDHSPSMLVYEDWYRCQSCGANGPTPTLLNKVKQKHGESYTPSYGYEESNAYPNPFYYWLKHESLGKVLKRAWTNANLNPERTIYLTKRGIQDGVRRELGIGESGNFFTFPVTDAERKIVGAFVRAGPGVPSSRYYVPRKQDPNLLYAPSWKRVLDSNVVFITFGPVDAISLYMLGYPSLSTLSGKTLDVTVLDDLRKVIVFIPDYGEDIEASRLAGKLGWRGKVCYFPYPNNTKDINDVYQVSPSLITNTLEDSYGNELARSKRNSGWISNFGAVSGNSS